MEFIATQKYLIMSPKKIRPVSYAIRKLAPAEAVLVLPHMPNKGADILVKVIKGAIANARQKGISEGDLVFKEIQISEGPRLKRGMAVSRGRWHPIKKRMSHIRVVLTTRNDQLNSKKIESKKGDPKSGTKN